MESRLIKTPIRNEELVKNKREDIIRAASEVFRRKGFHEATIRDICTASSMSPGTIYNYVKKKEDILYLIYDKMITMLTESLKKYTDTNKSPVIRLRKALEKTIDIAWDNRYLILLLYRETGSLDRKSLHNVLKRESNFVALLERILNDARMKGFVKNRNTEIVGDIIVYLMAFLPLRWWNLKRKFANNEKVAKTQLIAFISDALGLNS